MTGSNLAQLVVLVVFVLNSLLLVGLLTLKTIHRQRKQRHDRRRSSYVALISRHIVHENCTDPISKEASDDPAFLDALIDVRNAVVGTEVDTLRAIANRYGVARRQEARLQSDFPLGRRLRAAVALAEMGDGSSAPVLMTHLSDREPEIRIQAARGLARMKWSPAIDTVVARLGTEVPWVASRFADTLIAFGRKATWPLIAYIRINHRFESKGPVLAIRTLANIGDDEAVQPLLQVLDEATDAEIVLAAVEALGTLGSPIAVDPLTKVATAQDWRVRAKAVSALGDLADPGATPVLVKGLTDLNWWVRRNSAAALAETPEGLGHLYAALEGRDRYGADAAAEALTSIGALAAARRRDTDGEATPEDLALLSHMDDAAGVAT